MTPRGLNIWPSQGLPHLGVDSRWRRWFSVGPAHYRPENSQPRPPRARLGLGAWFPLVVALCTAACSDGQQGNIADPQQGLNHCQSDDDCQAGECDLRHSICVQPSEIRTALLEFTPAASDTEFGGFTFYQLLQDLSAAEQEQRFDLRVPPSIEGEVTLSLGNETCPQSEVEITFVPVERSLSIEAPIYTVRSSIVRVVRDRRPINLNTYRMAGLPSGRYDLYVRDAGLIDHSDTPECAVVPQVYRDQVIRLREGQSSLRLDLVLPRPERLQVFIPWHDQLEGWTADIIHAYTGERLSSVGVLTEEHLELLRPADDAEAQPNAVVSLRWSKPRGVGNPATELLRLQPPAGLGRPTVLWQLSSLQLFEDDEALVPEMSPFNDLTRFQAWVLDRRGRRVEGLVRFSALRLLDVPQGVFTQLEKTVEINDEGLAEVQLHPGEYRVHVMPWMDEWPIAAPANQAAFVSEVRVLRLANPDDVQAGQVIEVPPAASLSGRVAFQRASPAPGTLVQLEAAEAPSADLPPSTGFRPRYGDAIVHSDGRFEVSPVDCGHCTDSAPGAFYSLIVRSPAASGVPWFVVPRLEIQRSQDLGSLRLGLPSVYSGRLSQHGRPFSGVRVRAYALLDQFGEVVNDAELAWCSRRSSAPSDDEQRCVASAVPIAQTRSISDGTFRLLLPPSVGRL